MIGEKTYAASTQKQTTKGPSQDWKYKTTQSTQESQEVKIEIDSRINYSKAINGFVKFLCEQLNINECNIEISLLPADSNCVGLCFDNSETDFLVLVKQANRPIENIFLTIAHEIVHVMQYIHKNLGWYLDNHTHIPYEERWWEKEANQLSFELCSNFVQLKCK